jgi:lysophospholipid acyltransferase (LPLAT)-like uncharacterized protein
LPGEQHIGGLAGIPRRKPGLLRKSWIWLRTRIQSQPWFASVLVNVIYWYMKLVSRTNPLVKGSHDFHEVYGKNAPLIAAMWHGQHLMSPVIVPKGYVVTALLSRSADAEINARIVERFGHETVRGSGGRNEGNDNSKGGARALIALKRELDQGKSTAMIADISKSTARQAGMGVILLARLSGRPIVAVAYATSRRRILKKSWDQTAISLPFGRAAVISGKPLYVQKDADDAQMEAHRAELTKQLNTATEEAYRLADQRP